LLLHSYFHAHTTELFEGIKSKIEAGEAPYVDARHPDDEPTFSALSENS